MKTLAWKLAAVAAVALCGCSGNAAGSHPHNDGGQSGVDFAEPPGADLGFNSADGSAPAGLTISLITPAPFTSLQPLNTKFDFDVDLGGASQTQVESWIQIGPRGTSTSVTGLYVWTAKPQPSQYKLRFIPSASLTDATDYTVRADDPRAFPSPVLRAGFSTGSHPRVARADALKTAITFQFSEPMDPPTVTAPGAATVTFNGATVAGTVTSIDGTQYRFTFGAPLSGGGPVELKLALGVQAATAIAIDPQDWDASSVAMDGSFVASFGNVPLFQPATDVIWLPVVN